MSDPYILYRLPYLDLKKDIYKNTLFVSASNLVRTRPGVDPGSGQCSPPALQSRPQPFMLCDDCTYDTLLRLSALRPFGRWSRHPSYLLGLEGSRREI